MSRTRFQLRSDVFDKITAERGARTVRQQAKLTGLTKSTLGRMRAGKGQPSLPTAVHLADALGVPVSVLFEQVEDQ